MTFYILVRLWCCSTAPLADAPYVIGPYPTLEICRQAGHALIPDDRRFWTADDVEKADAKAKIQKAAYEAEKAQKIAALHGRAGTIRIGSDSWFDEYSVDAAGTAKWTSSGGGSSGISFGTTSSGPSYQAVTGCVRVEKRP